MKTILLVLTTLVLLSCGKKVNTTTLVQNPYDDTEIRAHRIIQDARIQALEDRMDAFQSHFDEVVIDFGTDLDNLDLEVDNLSSLLDSNLTTVNNALTNLQSQITGGKVELLRICTSNEHLIKTSSGVYAVYMISTNYGTYMGKLDNDVNYRTTDSFMQTFHLSNGVVVCH